MRSALTIACWVALFGSASKAAADPCRRDTPIQKQAWQRVNAVKAKISALSDGGQFDGIVRDLESLLHERCFETLRSGRAHVPQFDSAASLRDWWENGGKDWFDRATTEDAKPEVVIPPEPRRTLSLETTPNLPIAPLLCRLSDPNCGRETAGWVRRATESFGDGILEAKREKDELRKCADSARKAPPAQQFIKWRVCVERVRSVHDSMPLGHFKIPDSGWLILRGRRGHYVFADEIRAYDIATGAAWIARATDKLFRDDSEEESKRALGPPKDDAANRQRARERTIEIETGTLLKDNLREAAWFLFLMPYVERHFRSWMESFEIPAGILPRPLDDRDPTLQPNSEEVGMSGQTTIAWTWIQGKRVIASGSFTWGGGSHPSSYAEELVEIAEASLRKECPAPVPPIALPLGADRIGVSSLDAAAVELQVTYKRLLDELRDATSRGCKNPK
jgi:hypothetical protein